MEAFDTWLGEQLKTPTGSLLIPLVMVLGRCLAAALLARHDRRKKRKHIPKHA